MVRNSFEALSRIALVGLVSLVGCVDVDAPELGETADSATSGAVESSARAIPDDSDDLPSATAWECNQFGWGEVCSRTNSDYNFVGLFDNNKGGSNTAKITIRRDVAGPNQIVKVCDWHTVVYGESHKCIFYSPIAGAWYRTCVELKDGRSGCSGLSKVQ